MLNIIVKCSIHPMCLYHRYKESFLYIDGRYTRLDMVESFMIVCISREHYKQTNTHTRDYKYAYIYTHTHIYIYIYKYINSATLNTISDYKITYLTFFILHGNTIRHYP